MKNSHCSIIARRLAEGGIVDEKFLHQNHIRNQHKRLGTIQAEMLQEERLIIPDILFYKPQWPFWPIKNIGSTDGHLTNTNGGKTHCGRYHLPAKYRPALRRAIKKMGW